MSSCGPGEAASRKPSEGCEELKGQGDLISSAAEDVFGESEGGSISALGPQGWVVTLHQLCTSIQKAPGDYFSGTLPTWAKSRSALHSLASFSDAWAGGERAAQEQEKHSSSLQTWDSRPASCCRSVLASEEPSGPLELPEGCCGAEITGAGRVGVADPPELDFT